MSTNQVRWLSADEERAWRALRAMMVHIQTVTARDLAEHGLSEPDYEVLSTLSERQDGSSTLHAQADKMGWSRSRLSRHASRMQARGLIERDPDPTDGRGCLLTLTSEGHAVLARVSPHHVESVRRHVLDPLSPSDLRHLEHIAHQIIRATPADLGKSGARA